MSAKIFWKLFASVLFIAYAVSQLMPLRTTPFDEYVQTRATAHQEEFGKILQEADARIAAFKDPNVPAEKKSERMYDALRDIGAGKGEGDKPIDLANFFPDMKVVVDKNIPRRNNYVLQELMLQSQGRLKLGLDLQGGVSFTLRIDPKNFENADDKELAKLSPEERKERIEENKEAAQARMREGIARAVEVMEGRINAFGVAEPVIRPVGKESIEIQLPDPEIANNPDNINAIKKPAKLEFRMVHRYETPALGTPEHKIVPLRENPQDAASPVLDYEVLYQRSEDRTTGETREHVFYVKKFPEATGSIVKSARAGFVDGQYMTSIGFTSEGDKKFRALTGKIAEKNNAEGTYGRLAIVLDGDLVMAPGLRADPTTGRYHELGNCQIDAEDQKAADDLANVLNNPLEFPLELQDIKVIGSSLAADAQIKSVQAAAVGVGLVIVFMVLYYLWAGAISVVGLLVNVVLMLGIMAGFGATITLPGVAALVLTIGMAVDANILVFERIREELEDGKTLKAAVHAGYDRAQATIIDVHLTSMMTAAILIMMGTGPIKGFGIILAIGIVTTIFTVLVTCRALQEFCVDKGILTKVFGLHLFKGKTQFQFMNGAKAAFAASWLIVILSLGAFILKGGDAFSKDFKGGEAVIVKVAQDKKLDTGAIKAVAKEIGVNDVTPSYQQTVGEKTEQNLRIETELSAQTGQTDFYNANRVFEAVRAKYPDYFPQGEARELIVGREAIGGTVSGSLQENAILSIVLALLGIAVYVGLRFEFGMGLGAFVSSLHDVLLTTGIYILLGHQLSAAMIAAILLVIGYSINDTIVVFDRIREELKRLPGMNLRDVIHFSINRTLSRTVLTAVTVFFCAVSLYVLGAGDVREYGLIFIIGVVTGTFSSIYIASPIFFWWHKGQRDSVERAEAKITYSWEAGSSKKADEQ